jgi:hypothetical protein
MLVWDWVTAGVFVMPGELSLNQQWKSAYSDRRVAAWQEGQQLLTPSPQANLSTSLIEGIVAAIAVFGANLHAVLLGSKLTLY